MKDASARFQPVNKNKGRISAFEVMTFFVNRQAVDTVLNELGD